MAEVMGSNNILGNDAERDRQFYLIEAIVLTLFIGVGLVLNLIHIPEPDPREAAVIPEHYVKILIDRQTKRTPPPPAIEPDTPPEDKQPEDTPSEDKVKDEPKPKPEQSARDKAIKSGILALDDQLASLIDTDAVDDVLTASGTDVIGADGDNIVSGGSGVLTASAGSGSGGIGSGPVGTDNVGTTRLGERQHTRVQSEAQSNDKATKQRGNGKIDGGTIEAVQLVFDKNKGRIFSLYQRALRENPDLQGKAVFEITIEADGSVSKVRLLSSELNDPALEKKILSRVKRFKFPPPTRGRVTIKYPIEFLPS